MRCPTCKTEVDGARENRYRPFCSERCRMIDLGTWAGEGYRIAAEEQGETPSVDKATEPGGGVQDQRNRKIIH